MPGEARQRVQAVGACNGTDTMPDLLVEAAAAGERAAAACGHGLEPDTQLPGVPAPADKAPLVASWVIPKPIKSAPKRFIDFQNDVTAEDVGLAVREGYSDVEHLKRYTTLGMGTDQGRTSNVNGLALLGALTGREIADVGVTTFRPPFAPITLGALSGPEVGRDFAPVRRTPLHDWHLDAGAPMMNAGLWQRPQAYPRAGESLNDAIEREARLVRQAVGIVDVSTLGKIEVHGAHAAEFLERIYSNRFETLKVGRCRYGLMLREDGFVMDDGTATRIGEHVFT